MELKELSRAPVTRLRVAWAILPFSFLRKVAYGASTAYRSVLLLLLSSSSSSFVFFLISLIKSSTVRPYVFFCKFGQLRQLGPCPNVFILSHVFHLVKVLVYHLAIIIGNSLFERVIIIIIKCCCCRRRHCLHAKSLCDKWGAIRLSPAVAYY
jgi:hypothetical protein